MVWLVSVSPEVEYNIIGQYDSFDQCHKEVVHQNIESAYYAKFACIGKEPAK
jgi:hypothetical protein